MGLSIAGQFDFLSTVGYYCVFWDPTPLKTDLRTDEVDLAVKKKNYINCANKGRNSAERSSKECQVGR